MSKDWPSFSLKDVFDEVKSNNKGLSTVEAVQRLKKYGRNTLPHEKPYSKIRLFLSQFSSPLIYILLLVIFISFFLKQYSDAIFIVIILFINTGVGFYQENKANNSLAALKEMVKIKARVLRDGNEKEIDSEELVKGDIVILKSGDKVPADGRIIKSRGLKINEASLIGEAQAVEKEATTEVKKNTTLIAAPNMVFMGTIVEEGWASFVVLDTGINTQVGEIVSLLKSTKEKKTPLQKKVISLSKLLSIFIIVFVFLIMIIGFFEKKSFLEVFMSAMALVVSAIPEGLLPAITVILVLGMRRILKRGGLVRKVSSTETLGGVTVICTDKTGTLTQAKMQVSHILTSTKELLGDKINGLVKNGEINGIGSHVLALKAAVLANDSFIENPEAELEEWVVRGRPTEQALLVAGMNAGLNKKDLEKQYPILDKISFESQFKYSASFHRLNDKKNIFYVVGAPEKIIEQSISLYVDGKKEKLGGEQFNQLFRKFEGLTKKGLRVIACAYREYETDVQYKNLTELAKDLVLIGFIAIKDPLRPDVFESIATTKKAGIRTIIVTGDHKLTARAIAEEIGIKSEEKNILEGKDLEAMSDEELREKTRDVFIYARVSPQHKLRIVNALQFNGEVVAMFGDGVNDAPALKMADIGVVVGSGTDVAKEVADLVLLDDNFKTVVKAVEQGRVIFQNIRKVLVYLIADDFSEIFLFLVNMIMGFPLPLLPAQILWINLIEDGLPDIALTIEQETEGVMEEKPRKPKEPIFSKPLKKWSGVVFLVTGIASFLTFFILWKLTGDIEKTRTIVFVLMSFDSLIFAFSARSFKKTVFRKDLFSNLYLTGGIFISVLLLVAAVYLPALQKLLFTVPLGLNLWLLIIGVSLLEIIIIEFSKKRIFKR